MMAQSKNKRKNGKVVKNDQVKRMRNNIQADIKHLLICNVVDRGEIDGTDRMVPRSVVYSRKLKGLVTISRLQEVAMKTERWKWDVHLGVLCRNPDGTVYIDKEYSFLCKDYYLLTELNEYISEHIIERFEAANSLHRLTMFWVAAPVEQENCPLEAVLAPVWHFDVLGNMLTQWETDNPDHPVIRYRTQDLVEFCGWYLNQGRYKKMEQEFRTVTFWFEPTGEKMKKGELVNFRQALWDAGVNSQTPYADDHWKPFASVEAFCKGKFTLVCQGLLMSKLMSVFEVTPPCVNAHVQVRYSDGRENVLIWRHKQSYEELKGA